MFAIVEMGGKQYKVEEDQVIKVEKVSGEVGDRIQIDRILLLSDGDTVYAGDTLPSGAAVEAEVLEQMRDRKIHVFKYKRRKGYRRKIGHRQNMTKLMIKSIGQ